MRIPDMIFRGRDAIEGLVPRDSSISAVVHAGMGAGGMVGAAAVGSRFVPAHDPTKDRFDQHDLLERVGWGSVVAAGPLGITAGAQLAQQGPNVLRNGTSPMYFLAAGAIFAGMFAVLPAAYALRD